MDGQKFGEGESNHICGNIMKETGAHIEISHAKDLSLTFLVTGKQNEVLEARRRILIHFQTQVNILFYYLYVSLAPVDLSIIFI